MQHFDISIVKNVNFFCKKYLILLLSVLLSYWNITLANKDNTNKESKLATAVANHYIRSFASQAEEQKEAIQAEIKKHAHAPEHEIRPAKLDVATIRKTIFNNILARSGKLFAVQQQMQPILNEYAWADLKLFYGTTTDPSYNLMSRINKTTTVLGEAALATMLVTPTSDIQLLQERQYILKTFLNDFSQVLKLKDHLRIYQDAEQSMISFWTSTDPLYTKEYIKYMEDKFYAKGKDSSNKSAAWLEFKKRFYRDFLNIQSAFLWPLIYPTAMEIFRHEQLSGLAFTYSSIPDSTTKRKFMWVSAIPFYGGFYRWETLKKHAPEMGFAMGTLGVIIETAYLWTSYMGVKNYLEYSSVLRNLAQRMADAQTFIIIANQVSTTIAASPALEPVYGKHLTAVRELLAQSKENTELGRLIKYLQELPLSNWSYFFNNAGKLLASHKLFVEHKEAFSDAMYEVGLLDAHLSFATLMQEASAYNSKHKYVFAQFLDREQKTKPYVKIDDMWNPFLDSKQAVGNSIEMDAETGGIRNIILTGPNAGGKSTFLTGITNTLLLAHVMGIGPAKDIIITPFNRINTYIDIADDIAAGKSLFMAEVDRAQKHIKLLKELKPSEFSFTIFDEPFSGTNPIEGAAAEYSILEAIADYTNSLNMVATHYPTVMLLEERAHDKGFANYKVYITRQGASRKLNYTYKIVPGRSTQAIAIDILEEQGYDLKMLERAREIIEHPERYQASF
ncbi:MAG: MutS-related protein [Candidatus Amoebophilus sp.]